MSELVRVARLLRGYLPTLLDAAEAAAYDQRIADLLAADRAGRPIDDDLVELVASSPALHAWVARVLESPWLLPQEISERYTPLAGNRAGSDLQRYACPVDGDVEWYRVSLSDPVPICPQHGTALVLVGPA